MTKMEKIQSLLDDVESDIRKSIVRDILADLRDFAKDAIDEERPGFKAAIEVIEANY
jgi:hypothetical protein